MPCRPISGPGSNLPLAHCPKAAAAPNEARGDIEPHDLLRAIGNLSVASGEEGAAHTARMLDLLIDGLRHGLERPVKPAAHR
jgi:hypothetical protein